MKVEFYFDVSCPWCWITSRWLSEVQAQRDLRVAWKPFSLALKNGELGGGDSSSHAAIHLSAHQLMRLIQAVQNERGQEVVGELYTALGTRWHNQDHKTTAIAVEALAACHIDNPDQYLSALDDSALDAALQQSLDDAIAVVGNDVGVPTIIFDTAAGKTGFFGPVLSELPETADSLKLWDGLAIMATNPNFYELKRSRGTGPNVASVARLLG